MACLYSSHSLLPAAQSDVSTSDGVINIGATVQRHTIITPHLLQIYTLCPVVTQLDSYMEWEKQQLTKLLRQDII